MTDPIPQRPWGQRLLVAVMVAVTIGITVLVAVNAYLLGRTTAEVQAAQAQSANVGNATRENLVLLQLVSQLGVTATPQQVAVQRGLLLRQIAVSIVSYPPGSAEVTELEGVRTAINKFPWGKLQQDEDRNEELRRACMALVSQSERRVNALRSEEEKRFYSATSASLNANQRSQVGLSVLVAVVLGLGITGVIVVTRRSRSDIAVAYHALMGEVVERQAAEGALRKSEGRFRSLVQRASDLTVVTDQAGVITYVSPAAETLLGHSPADLLGLPLLIHVEPNERAEATRMITFLAEEPGRVHTIELRLRTSDGRIRLVEAVCQNLLDDSDVGGLVWNGRDVTDRRALEDELTYQASHDPLTGLPNRKLLLRRLDEAMKAAPAGAGVSAILIDLDGFKNVNDTLGHAAGDELLRAAAKRLLGCVRDGDTAARLGGDEFAVVAASGNPRHAVSAGQRIVDVLRQPFTVTGNDVRVSASVGIAHRNGVASAEDLLRDADIAMYVAKHTGKGRVEVFQPDMRIKASQRTRLQQELARAVDLGEIEVNYQPIIDLKTFRPTSLEGLARWRRADGSMVPTETFIPIAEDSGSIIDIGREVLRQSCRAIQLWRALPGYSDLEIAVNVSVHQVLSGRLVEHVTEALRDSGAAGSTLVLEITESSALENSERVAAEFTRLHELGVRIAVDDFGAGYSSLGFLMGLNADCLKIDRTLLDFDTTRHGSLVTAIAELGRTLGLTVVVEGVETPEHLARAREAPCDAAQGFHFSRPMPIDDVAEFLLSWSGAPISGRTGAPHS
jgi:diguanylate cyclase (GGDEF)-like protein/PAS domain S-box-containing protein